MRCTQESVPFPSNLLPSREDNGGLYRPSLLASQSVMVRSFRANDIKTAVADSLFSLSR